MIKILKKLSKNKIQNFETRCSYAKRKVRTLKNQRKLTSSSFLNKWTELKKDLDTLHHSKCAYCENIKDLEDFTIDHYRPKMKKDGKLSKPFYWWMAYKPDNYLLACRQCNTDKSDSFPLIKEKDRCLNPRSNLKKEQAYIINPMFDDIDPEDCINYKLYKNNNVIAIKVHGIDSDNRGQMTIDILKLNNRDSLKRAWIKNFKEIEDLITIIQKIPNQNVRDKEFKSLILKYTHHSARFSSLNKQFIKLLQEESVLPIFE